MLDKLESVHLTTCVGAAFTSLDLTRLVLAHGVSFEGQDVLFRGRLLNGLDEHPLVTAAKQRGAVPLLLLLIKEHGMEAASNEGLRAFHSAVERNEMVNAGMLVKLGVSVTTRDILPHVLGMVKRGAYRLDSASMLLKILATAVTDGANTCDDEGEGSGAAQQQLVEAVGEIHQSLYMLGSSRYAQTQVADVAQRIAGVWEQIANLPGSAGAYVSAMNLSNPAPTRMELPERSVLGGMGGRAPEAKESWMSEQSSSGGDSNAGWLQVVRITATDITDFLKRSLVDLAPIASSGVEGSEGGDSSEGSESKSAAGKSRPDRKDGADGADGARVAAAAGALLLRASEVTDHLSTWFSVREHMFDHEFGIDARELGDLLLRFMAHLVNSLRQLRSFVALVESDRSTPTRGGASFERADSRRASFDALRRQFIASSDDEQQLEAVAKDGGAQGVTCRNVLAFLRTHSDKWKRDEKEAWDHLGHAALLLTSKSQERRTIFSTMQKADALGRSLENKSTYFIENILPFAQLAFERERSCVVFLDWKEEMRTCLRSRTGSHLVRLAQTALEYSAKQLSGSSSIPAGVLLYSLARQNLSVVDTSITSVRSGNLRTLRTKVGAFVADVNRLCRDTDVTVASEFGEAYGAILRSKAECDKVGATTEGITRLGLQTAKSEIDAAFKKADFSGDLSNIGASTADKMKEVLDRMITDQSPEDHEYTEFCANHLDCMTEACSIDVEALEAATTASGLAASTQALRDAAVATDADAISAAKRAAEAFEHELDAEASEAAKNKKKPKKKKKKKVVGGGGAGGAGAGGETAAESGAVAGDATSTTPSNTVAANPGAMSAPVETESSRLQREQSEQERKQSRQREQEEREALEAQWREEQAKLEQRKIELFGTDTTEVDSLDDPEGKAMTPDATPVDTDDGAGNGTIAGTGIVADADTAADRSIVGSCNVDDARGKESGEAETEAEAESAAETKMVADRVEVDEKTRGGVEAAVATVVAAVSSAPSALLDTKEDEGGSALSSASLAASQPDPVAAAADDDLGGLFKARKKKKGKKKKAEKMAKVAASSDGGETKDAQTGSGAKLVQGGVDASGAAATAAAAPATSSSWAGVLAKKKEIKEGYSHAWNEGDPVDALDYFTSQAGKKGEKWRKATVVSTTPTHVGISFVGWDKKFNITINLQTEPHRVAGYGLQTDVLEQLAEAQRVRERVFK